MMVEHFGESQPDAPTELFLRTRFNRVIDAQGRLLSIEYPNGDSIEFQYTSDNRIKAITDTISGTQIVRGADDTWSIVHSNGTRAKVDGTILVDQSTGAVSAHLNNGTRVTTHPNGSVTVSQNRGGNSHG